MIADLSDVGLYYRDEGAGAPLVLVGTLGTDLRIWDKLVPCLPGLRILRYDLRGHGLSGLGTALASMGTMVRDLERLLDHFEIRDAVVLGTGLGGMIAQGLAVKRLDQVRALVLANTAAKIATRGTWDAQIDRVRAEGIEAIADDLVDRWFSRGFRATPEAAIWRRMLTRTPVAGYMRAAQSIAGTDLMEPVSGLTLPTLGIVGDADGLTPPDLVRESVELIRGADFHLIRRAGHFPAIEQPETMAQAVTSFLRRIGHL